MAGTLKCHSCEKEIRGVARLTLPLKAGRVINVCSACLDSLPRTEKSPTIDYRNFVSWYLTNKVVRTPAAIIREQKARIEELEQMVAQFARKQAANRL